MKSLIFGAGSIGLRHGQILNELNIDVAFITKRTDLEYNSYLKMDQININNFDYFIIANETLYHYETLKKLTALVENKIILIENPLFMESGFLDTKNNKCYVGYNLRFHPIVECIKENLINDDILSIELFCGHFLPDWNPWRDYRKTYSAKSKLGGGVLRDLTHEIDLLYFFTGSEVNKRYSNIYEKISSLDIETKDFYRTNGFIDGTYFSIGLDYISRIPRRNIVIYTNQKTINADLIESSIHVMGANDQVKKKVKVKLNSTYEKMHKSILFKDGKNVCDFNGGLRILKWYKI